MLELSDKELLLGTEEQRIIDEASEFLKLGVPSRDETVKVHTFISKAIVHEEKLSSLKFVLGVVYSREWHKLKQYEADNWSELRDEHSSTDAKYYHYRDDKVRDMSHKVDTLKAYLERVDSLIWQVKKVVEVLNK